MVWPYRGAQYKMRTSDTAIAEAVYNRKAGYKTGQVSQEDLMTTARKIDGNLISLPGWIANSQISSTEVKELSSDA